METLYNLLRGKSLSTGTLTIVIEVIGMEYFLLVVACIAGVAAGFFIQRSRGEKKQISEQNSAEKVVQEAAVQAENAKR